MNGDNNPSGGAWVTFTSEKTIRVSKPSLTVEGDTLKLCAEVSGGARGTCFFSTPLANRDFVDGNSSDCTTSKNGYTCACKVIKEGAFNY